MKAHKEFCKSYEHPEMGCMVSADCEACEIIWKAALKWALKNKEETENDMGITFDYVPTHIIEKEIENE